MAVATAFQATVTAPVLITCPCPGAVMTGEPMTGEPATAIGVRVGSAVAVGVSVSPACGCRTKGRADLPSIARAGLQASASALNSSAMGIRRPEPLIMV